MIGSHFSSLLFILASFSHYLLSFSLVREQNNSPSFGTKSTSSRVPTGQKWLVSIYTTSIKDGLGTADCGLQTTDPKGYKTQTYE